MYIMCYYSYSRHFNTNKIYNSKSILIYLTFTNQNHSQIFPNPLSANPTKWSNTLKQLIGKLPTNCLSVFDHFARLALKGLI